MIRMKPRLEPALSSRDPAGAAPICGFFNMALMQSDLYDFPMSVRTGLGTRPLRDPRRLSTETGHGATKGAAATTLAPNPERAWERHSGPDAEVTNDDH